MPMLQSTRIRWALYWRAVVLMCLGDGALVFYLDRGHITLWLGHRIPLRPLSRWNQDLLGWRGLGTPGCCAQMVTGEEACLGGWLHISLRGGGNRTTVFQSDGATVFQGDGARWEQDRYWTAGTSSALSAYRLIYLALIVNVDGISKL